MHLLHMHSLLCQLSICVSFPNPFFLLLLLHSFSVNFCSVTLFLSSSIILFLSPVRQPVSPHERPGAKELPDRDGRSLDRKRGCTVVFWGSSLACEARAFIAKEGLCQSLDATHDLLLSCPFVFFMSFFARLSSRQAHPAHPRSLIRLWSGWTIKTEHVLGRPNVVL